MIYGRTQLAYNRVVSLKAGDQLSAYEINDLHFEFEVDRSRDFKSNIAKIKIYNPNETTINNILDVGSSIVLEAGYEDEGTGLIYSGQITTSFPDNNGVDTILQLESNSLQGSKELLASLVVSLSYAPESSVDKPIKEIANIMGLATYGLENISDIIMQNGYVFTGLAKEALRYCKDIIEKEGFIVFIDNDTIIVSSEASPEEVNVTDLRQETGLLNAAPLKSTKNKGKKDEKKLENKITFTSIMNPQIAPNKHIQVDNRRTINGLYVVDKCFFRGSNFGSKPYIVRGEAIES
jgi:hypothetical protein